MKCFHFTIGKRRDDDETEPSFVSREPSKVSWARSLSVTSSSYDNTNYDRRSEFDSDSRDMSDSAAFYALLSQLHANYLRVVAFSKLKSASRGFSRALLIGEGGFAGDQTCSLPTSNRRNCNTDSDVIRPLKLHAPVREFWSRLCSGSGLVTVSFWLL